MSGLITLLLLLVVIIAIVFAITFTVVTIYIAINHRVPSKYHFTGTVEMREETRGEILAQENQKSQVDSENAQKEWERKKGKEQF